MRALLVADDAGQGHVIRCGALAAELERQAWETQVIGPNEEIPLISAYDVAILDLRDNRFPLPGARKLVRIADVPGTAAACDLLVCGSAGADPDMFKGLAPRALAGPSFSLLRPEFTLERDTLRLRAGFVDLRLAGGMTALQLAEELGMASVAISFGGMRAMEATCLGTPCVLIPRNRGEELNASGIVAAKAGVIADPTEAPIVVEEMLSLPSLLMPMSEKAKALVDGRGLQRVAQAIQELAA